MFKQVKKARALMDDTKYKHDEFNKILILLFIIFFLATIGIWIYWQSAEYAIEKDIKVNNLIIDDFQTDKKINNAIDIYGNVHDE